MIKVLIIDDHRLVIEGIELMLSSIPDIQIIGHAFDGVEGLDQIEKLKPDVILLDLNMPKKNGLEVCVELAKKSSEVKIIVLSMMNELKLIQKLIENNASGYLLKNCGQDEIVEAIRKVANDEKHFDKDVLVQLMTSSSKQKKSLTLIPKISKREKEILHLILDEFTSAEISKKLFISIGTVETHRRNLINKLGVRNTAGLVKKTLEYGLI